MASSVKKLRACKSRRAAPYDCDLFAGTNLRLFFINESVLERILYYILLVVFCRYRFAYMPACTRRLTKRRAYPSGKLGEAVCLRKPPVRLLVVTLINKFVRLRNQIVKRASRCHVVYHDACLAERNAA